MYNSNLPYFALSIYSILRKSKTFYVTNTDFVIVLYMTPNHLYHHVIGTFNIQILNQFNLSFLSQVNNKLIKQCHVHIMTIITAN